jgi:hypothetical protein
MGKRACTFKEADVVRAIRAATKAGLPVARVEIASDGKIVVVAGKPHENAETGNPWDEVLSHDRH